MKFYHIKVNLSFSFSSHEAAYIAYKNDLI